MFDPLKKKKMVRGCAADSDKLSGAQLGSTITDQNIYYIGFGKDSRWRPQ